MKKLSGLIIFTLFFFTLKSYGGNPLLLPTSIKNITIPLSFYGDTGKKAPTADTTKKTPDDDTADDDDNIRSYTMGLTYGSDQSFHGVHSNKKIPYVEPNFTYTAPSGFYVLLSFQDIRGQSVDAYDFNPGWNIDLADNTTLNMNVSAYKFKKGTSATIKSSLSNEVAAYIDQSIGQTEGRFTIAYDYYKQTDSLKTPGDIIFTPDLEHTFKITLSKKSSLSIIPEADIDFGTRNAFSQYEAATDTTDYKYVKKGGKEVKVFASPNNTSFGTVDYNLILTVDFKIGNFEIEPAYAHNKSLYNPPGVPSTPLNTGTLAVIYTIDHQCKK